MFLIASQFSLHAFGLPGKVMIKVSCRIPETGRDKAAKGVTAVEVASRTCVNPGVCLDKRGSIAL